MSRHRLSTLYCTNILLLTKSFAVCIMYNLKYNVMHKVMYNVMYKIMYNVMYVLTLTVIP